MAEQSRTRIRSPAAAHFIGISQSTLAKWRSRGVGPVFHRCGDRIIYYFEDELQAWLEECDKRAGRSPKPMP